MTENDLKDDLLDGVQEIASYLGFGLRRTYYLIQNGTIPTRKLGARTIIGRRSEIDAAMRARPARPERKRLSDG